MSTRHLAGGLTAAAILALALSGCSGEPEITESDLAVVALASQIAEQIPAEQAHCTAEAIVAKRDPAALRKAGALTDDGVSQLNGEFDAATAGAIADATVSCWDWRKYTATFAAAYPTAEPAAWDTYVACAEKLNDKLRDSIYNSNLEGGDDAAQKALTTAEAECRKPLGPVVNPN